MFAGVHEFKYHIHVLNKFPQFSLITVEWAGNQFHGLSYTTILCSILTRVNSIVLFDVTFTINQPQIFSCEPAIL